MQGKVANMQNAFKGAVQKSKSNWVAVAASTVALLSTIGLFVVLSSGEDSAQVASAGLADKVVKLEANEEFYLGLKKKLEDENRELTKERKDLERKNESLRGELAQGIPLDERNSGVA